MDLPQGVLGVRGGRGLARAGRGGMCLLPHRVVRGRGPAGGGDRRAGRARWPPSRPRPAARGGDRAAGHGHRHGLRAGRARPRAGPADLGGGPRAGPGRRPLGRADRPGLDRRPGQQGRDAVLAGRARLRVPGRQPGRGPDRPARPGGAVLVPGHGRAPAPAQPGPHRRLGAARPGQGPGRGGARTPAAAWSPTSTRRRGGTSPTPKATRPTWPPGWNTADLGRAGQGQVVSRSRSATPSSP